MKLGAILTVVGSAAAVLVAAPAQAVPLPDQWTFIRNVRSYKVLEAKVAGSGVGVYQVETGYEDGPQGSFWRVAVDPDGRYRFRNGLTLYQFALTVNTAVAWVNQPMIVGKQAPNATNQKWTLITKGVNQFAVKNVATGKCLGIPGNGTVNGQQAYAMQECDTANPSQQWYIEVFERS